MPRGIKKEEGLDEKTNAIKLAKDFRLCFDRFCCLIEQETEYEERIKGTKTGKMKKEWRRVAGYCPNYESLFNDLYQKRCFREIESGSAGSAIKKMKEIQADTKAMIEALVGGGYKDE